MVEHLYDEENFKTPFMVPTLGRKSSGYHNRGGDYWRGAVWIPTNMMVIKGLQEYGYVDESYEVALSGLEGIYKTWKTSGKFFENYDQEQVGKCGNKSKSDFVGWTGVQPIAGLIEYVIGIRTDAPNNSINWTLRLSEKHGLKNLKWGFNYNKEVDLIAEPGKGPGGKTVISVKTNSPFVLKVDTGNGKEIFKVDKAGIHKFYVPFVHSKIQPSSKNR